MFNFKYSEPGKGKITIDAFEESFLSEFSFWSQSEYETQWEQAKSLISQGRSACFITSINKPSNSNFVRCWACYPKEQNLVFQERIIFLEDLNEKFDINNPHKYVLPYENKTEDGEAISEWVTKNEKEI